MVIYGNIQFRVYRPVFHIGFMPPWTFFQFTGAERWEIDIIWMMRDEVRIHDDERIARHILDNRTTGKSETLMENSIELGPSDNEEGLYIVKPENGRAEHLSQDFLRKYIAFAKRTVHPQLDQEAKNAILKY